MRERANELLVSVEGIDYFDDGRAYAMVDGQRVRIEGVIPGEQVDLRVTHTGRGTPTGEVTGIVRASGHRVTPRCPFFGPCGGCMWQHIAYDEQLRLKERMLQQVLSQAIGAAAPQVSRMLTGGDPWAFRNKVHFVFAPGPRGGALVLGHYRRGSTSVLEVDQCPVHAAAGNRVAFAMRDALLRARIEAATADGRRGIARHIVVRATERPRETLATLVVTRNDKRLRSALRSIVAAAGAPDGLALNFHDQRGPYLFGDETLVLHGRPRVREQVAGISFLISPTAFFQTNVRAADAMVRFVLDQVADSRTALDLYAGAGLFALPLASRGIRVTAVEENAEAVKDGESSRQFNRIAQSSCTFVRARAESLARGTRARGIPASPDLVVLDPPRTGCPPNVLAWIANVLRPRQIIYVSCNPAALAGDLRVPLAARYELRTVQPIDMFPHTSHIEAVAVLHG